jgi:hypothetical protein
MAVGALNIDTTRVGTEARSYKGAGKTDKVYSESGAGMLDGRGRDMEFSAVGRWPANFILIGEDAKEALDNRNEKVSEFFKQFKKRNNLWKK